MFLSFPLLPLSCILAGYSTNAYTKIGVSFLHCQIVKCLMRLDFQAKTNVIYNSLCCLVTNRLQILFCFYRLPEQSLWHMVTTSNLKSRRRLNEQLFCLIMYELNYHLDKKLSADMKENQNQPNIKQFNKAWYEISTLWAFLFKLWQMICSQIFLDWIEVAESEIVCNYKSLDHSCTVLGIGDY